MASNVSRAPVPPSASGQEGRSEGLVFVLRKLSVDKGKMLAFPEHLPRSRHTDIRHCTETPQKPQATEVAISDNSRGS